ncbi:MAG: DUF3352 domain-containing protein [Thermoleophilaceae bacterium]
MLSPRLSHAVPVLVAAAAIAFAGCGGDDEAASPLDEALGYLSEDAGFAFVASTNLDDYGDLRQILDKFPFAGRAEDLLEQSISQAGFDFEEDVEPLLGNPVVIGTDENASFLDSESDTPFVMAIETEDAGKLEDLMTKDARDAGESEGYDIYQGQQEDTWIAIKDEVLVLSDSEETLKDALAQRGEDDRLTEDDVDAAFEDLPEDAPVKAYANVKSLLAASPESEKALEVEWVDHIETFGLSADATDDGVALDWSLRTDPEGLTDDDLPLASGSEAPQLLERDDGSAEIVLGLRDPAQIVDFALATAEVVDPAGFAEFGSAKQQVERRLGVDIDQDVLAQLTGDVSAVVSIDGKFGARAELDDAAAFDRTLAKIVEGLPEFSDDVTIAKAGGRYYTLSTEDGERYALGVAQGALVVASDLPTATQVASRAVVDAEGQEGAFVASADAEQLANAALARLAGGLQGLGGSLFTGPLGDLLTSASASTDGLTGRLELKIE